MPRKQSQKQLDNLKPPFSPKEARENGSKGGKASGPVRREKTAARDVARIILAGEIPVEGAKALVSKMGLPETEMNVQAAILAGQALEAIKGNVRAAEYLYGLTGETSGGIAQDGAAAYSGLPARVLGREWVDINRDIDERRHSRYDFKGGRGSLKSSFCGLKVVDLIMRNDDYCGLAVKQHFNEIKDSVYAQIVWAIDELGLTEQFHCTKSPFEIRREATGQIIFFRGADDPMKLKSLKAPNGMHIGVIWAEEADQLRGAEAWRNILQSAMRGGDDCIAFRSYNTPRSQQHFINAQEREADASRIVHHSHFRNAPPEWLGKSFYELAEHTKETNETAYRHEYDGEAVGNGANVFENVIAKTISDEEINRFDRTYYGLDFGWYPDPNHFCECYFNAAQRKLYIFGEIRRHKTSNEIMAELLAPWRQCRITADSAEQKSVNDFRDYGFDMRGAIKGPGSVEYSMKWLASLSEIVIDNTRCPFAVEEFLNYEYERDKDGCVISGYPDHDNHAIDSVRYALEEIWRRRGQ